MLEVAAGTGIVTAELLRTLPDAQITATDLNPAMVSWAAQRVSGPSWLPADAQCLQFPDASFDMVVCQFGVMCFPDKTKAFAEAERVLRPGGVFVFPCRTGTFSSTASRSFRPTLGASRGDAQ